VWNRNQKWLIVLKNEKNTLEKASVEMIIAPFADFIAKLVIMGVEGKPEAKINRLTDNN